MFSRLDFICKEKKMTPSDRYAIQTMRRNCNSAMGDNFQPDMNEYLYDLRAIVRFISLGFEEDIPASILPADSALQPPVQRNTPVAYPLRQGFGEQLERESDFRID